MSQDEIDRMVSDAEKFKDEDDKQREKVTARNSFESYIFIVKQALDSVQDKISPEEKANAKTACDEALKWLDGNSLAEKEEFDNHLKELQSVTMPIMTKLHSEGQGEGNTPHNNNSSGPTVEEMD